MQQQESLSQAFKPLTLEFLIPSYKRPDSLVQAIFSITSQVQELELTDRVTISIVDDASPNISDTEIIELIKPFTGFVRFRKNSINKGMSLNIRDMVAESKSDFCTILTDDDRLQSNTLQEIIQTLDSLDETIGSFFVPRYSYLEDGSLHCIVCKPLNEDIKIEPSYLNSLKYLHNGFILTGLFFKPQIINFQLWDENIENSFFPIIYFANLLLNYHCLFINRNWFIHTVLNECHWDSWGTTEQMRLSRLYRDYMEAVTISAKQAALKISGILPKVHLFKEEFACYQNQIQSIFPELSRHNRSVSKITSSRSSYHLSLANYRPKRNLNILRAYLSKIKQKLFALFSK